MLSKWHIINFLFFPSIILQYRNVSKLVSLKLTQCCLSMLSFFSVPLKCVYYMSLSYSISFAISVSLSLPLCISLSSPLVLLSLLLSFSFSIFSFSSLTSISEFHNDPFCDPMACLPLPLTIGKSYNSLTTNPRRKLWFSSTWFKIFEMLDRITSNGKIYTLVGCVIASWQGMCSVTAFFLPVKDNIFIFIFKKSLMDLKQIIVKMLTMIIVLTNGLTKRSSLLLQWLGYPSIYYLTHWSFPLQIQYWLTLILSLQEKCFFLNESLLTKGHFLRHFFFILFPE